MASRIGSHQHPYAFSLSRRYFSSRSLMGLSFCGTSILTILSVTIWWRKLRSKNFAHPVYQVFPVSSFICQTNEAEVSKYIEEVTELYDLDTDQLEAIRVAIQGEMEAGLLPNNTSSLKMLPSYVDRLPLGRLNTTTYALDIGGTNLRILKVVLEHDGAIRNVFTNRYSIPPELMVGEGKVLISFIARCLLESADISKTSPLGFTFSFPTRQTSIKQGYLLEWTKGFSASGVVGEDVSKLLEEELERQNFPIKITALVNDTIGTLMTGAFQAHDENCMIGLILGTGSNACYLEETGKIEKWTGKLLSPSGKMIINIELGGFDSPAYTYLSPTKFDLMLDNESINAGCQHLEKMISGMYLGELVRLTLKNYHDMFDIFSDDHTGILNCPYQFSTQFLSQIEQDDSLELHGVGAVLKRLGIPSHSLAIRQFTKKICYAVSRRSARLIAASVTAIIEHQKRGSVLSIVAVDGAIFELYPGYRSIIEESIKELGYPNVQLRLVKDGSGNGAAITASTVAGNEQSVYS